MVVAAAARERLREEPTTSISALVDEVFAGVSLSTRALPDSVTRTLETLDAARRGPAVAGAR